MRLSVRVIDQDGNGQTISGVKREDWENMNNPCPVCGGLEFNHFSVSGGHYGLWDSAVVMRSDFWDAYQSQFTRCRECHEILYKHPAFDLLFPSDDSGEAERLEKHLSGVDVLFTNSEGQWIVIRIPANLVAALGPHVDSVDPRKREWSFTELWDDIDLLNRGWADAATDSDELAGCAAYALVDERPSS